MRLRLEIILLSLITILCPLAYHPSFIGERGISNERVVYPMLIIIGVLALITVRSFGKSNKLIRAFFLSSVFISFEVALFCSLGLNSTFSEIVTYMQCLIGLLIGYNLLMNDVAIFNLLRLYAIASLVIGIISVFSGVGSFEVVDQYLIVGKNASGVMMSLAGAISFFLSTIDKSKFIRLVDYIIVFLCLLVLMTFRARLAMLSLLFVILLYMLKTRSFKIIFGVLLSLIIVLCFFPDVISFFYDSLFMNKEDDISSGRFDLNKSAFLIISESPFIGNLAHDFSLLDEVSVHNYFLKKMSDYGIFLSLPWIILYVYLMVYITHSFMKRKGKDYISVLSRLLMIILLLESFGEYTYPFGPGTITIIPFILLGYSEHRRMLMLARRRTSQLS